MKLTKLVIAPVNSWQKVGDDNPLRAVVTIASEKSSVETVLSDETAARLLALCVREIAENARQNVNEFADAVTAINGSQPATMLTEE